MALRISLSSIVIPQASTFHPGNYPSGAGGANGSLPPASMTIGVKHLAARVKTSIISVTSVGLLLSELLKLLCSSTILQHAPQIAPVLATIHLSASMLFPM